MSAYASDMLFCETITYEKTSLLPFCTRYCIPISWESWLA